MRRAGYSVLAPVLALAMLSACAPQLTAPISEKSSLLVVSMTIEASGLFGTVNKLAEPLTLKVTDGAGAVSSVTANGANDGYYLFPNVVPGKYELSGAAFPSKGGSTSTKKVASSGNVSITSTTTSGGSFASAYQFDPQLVQSTAVTVGEGRVAYLGHFDLKAEIKLFPRRT